MTTFLLKYKVFKACNFRFKISYSGSPIASEVLVTTPGPSQLNKHRRTVTALVTLVQLQLARHCECICILLSGFGPVQIYTSTKDIA